MLLLCPNSVFSTLESTQTMNLFVGEAIIHHLGDENTRLFVWFRRENNPNNFFGRVVVSFVKFQE